MKNKKGFTLIELLAVIVILGIIMSIAGMSVMSARKKSNIETAKKLEKTLKDLGAQVYTYEMMKKGDFYEAYKNLKTGGVASTNGKCQTSSDYSITVSLTDLAQKSYLKSGQISNPGSGDKCQGFVRICKYDDGAPSFDAKICCPNVYDSNGKNGKDSKNGEICGNYKKTSSATLSD